MECHRPKRSLSPNHVVINGLVIDRRDSLEDHKAILGNITEESDPIPSDLDQNLTSSSENQDDHIDQTELSKLAGFLGSLDETAKTQIVDTLINIYKKEILTSLKQCEETTTVQNNLKSYKSLASKPVASTQCQYDRKDCPSSKLVHFKEDYLKESRLIQEGLKSLAKPYHELSSETPKLNGFDQKYEEDLYKLLGRPCKKPISQTEHVLVKYDTSEDYSTSLDYEKLKKKWENPLDKMKQLVSEGIQASTPTKKRRKPLKKSSVNYVKPFKYPKQSRSDMAINCPFGCTLRLKKSQSATDFRRSRADVSVDRKSSRELLKAKELRRKNQLIRYLDADLKRGDSSMQFSQILFETANKNMDNEVSNMEIPLLDNKQVDNFNANYLLHSLKLATQTKSSVVLSMEQLCYTESDVSVTEEDYRRWLKKRNLSRYYTRSEEEFLSVSQTKPPQTPRTKRKITWSEPPPEKPSTNLDELLEEMGELFLYEHVVISRALNFFLTLHVQRTRVFTKWERLLQVMFVGVFYCLWWYFGNYVYVDATLKKSTTLWK